MGGVINLSIIVDHCGIPGSKINITKIFLHSSDCGVFFLSFKSSSVVLLCYEEKSLLFNGSIEGWLFKINDPIETLA